MKKIILILLAIACVLLSPLTAASQLNLVSNWSFDDNPLCSENIDDLPGWDRLAGNPQAFHFCNPNDSFQHPQNYMGYQLPEESDGYIGLKTYYYADSSRDYVGTVFTSPIFDGDSIRVRIALVHADSSDWRSSGLGVLLCNGAYRNTYPYSTHTGANAFIPIIANGGEDWYELEFSFTSDSTYDRLEIGNFFPNDSTLAAVSLTRPRPFAYYYIDNVRVQRYTPLCVCAPSSHLHAFGSFINEIGQPCDESYYGMRIGTCACGESRRFLNIQ